MSNVDPKNPPTQAVTKPVEKTICDHVLTSLRQMETEQQITLPKDYSAANALKSAWLMLQEAVDKDKKPVLDVCTRNTIANALLDMCVQGLNPAKKQCYFIAYGNKLQLSRSYMGTLAVARRVGGLIEANAQVVYQGDEFAYEVDPNSGRIKILNHNQDFANIDTSKIKGAYCVLLLEGGKTKVEVMSIAQIKKAWEQGATKGGSPAHNNFTDQMAIKSVINRACKILINSSDDSSLYFEDPEIITSKNDEANTKDISFELVVDEKPEIKQGPGKEAIKPEPVSQNGQAAPF